MGSSNQDTPVVKRFFCLTKYSTTIHIPNRRCGTPRTINKKGEYHRGVLGFQIMLVEEFVSSVVSLWRERVYLCESQTDRQTNKIVQHGI